MCPGLPHYRLAHAGTTERASSMLRVFRDEPRRFFLQHLAYVLCRCHSLRVALAGRKPLRQRLHTQCRGQHPTAARGVEPPGCQVGLALVADDVGAARPAPG